MENTIALEIEIQREIEQYLNDRRIFHFRPNCDGLPDIVVCYKGRFIGLETKRPNVGRVQGHQKTIGAEITKSGGISIFPRSLEEVIRLFRKVDIDVEWEK